MFNIIESFISKIYVADVKLNKVTPPLAAWWIQCNFLCAFSSFCHFVNLYTIFATTSPERNKAGYACSSFTEEQQTAPSMLLHEKAGCRYDETISWT